MSAFACLVEHPEGVRLKGAAAQTPLRAGQMVIGHGTYEDGSETGPGAFLVLRQLGAKEYLLAPFGTSDGDWSSYLSDKTTVKAVLLRTAKDAVPKDKELLRRWRVVSESGEVPKRADYEIFGKKIADGVEQKWNFLNELVVSEKPPPEAATDPHFSVSVNNAGH